MEVKVTGIALKRRSR